MKYLTRRAKIAILVVVDSILVALANIEAYYFMKPFVLMDGAFLWKTVIISVLLYLFYGAIFKVFTRINRYTSLREMISIFFATTFAAVSDAVILDVSMRTVSMRVALFTYMLSTLFIITSRLAWRLMVEYKNSKNGHELKAKRTLIVGAGEGGRILYDSIIGSSTAGDIDVVGFIDDDPDKKNTFLSGVKILGKTSDLPEIIKDKDVDMVTIAIPSIPRKSLQKIIDLLKDTPVLVNTMPALEELASGRVNVSRMKEIDVVDLLGRDEVKLDMDAIKDQLTGKTILVTGAGGSIGSEICRQVTKFNPCRILLLGHGENSIYLIHRELTINNRERPTEFIPLIADVQDRDLIFKIMAEHQPDIVYHAAAHKHVPLMEYNPREAVKNNVYGSKNVAEAAKAANVKNFVMVSTDKANNPPNVMGATKRMAEMIVTGLNEEGKTKFSAVRFGNVLGSRGSVIPLFREQIAKGGPVTVTDFRMTRYFMTIPEASRLVIQSGALAKGGEIFILDMGDPVKIVDLAKNMIRLSGYSEEEIQIVETGIRPGEKLYEELLLDKERNDEEVYEKIFVGNIKGYTKEEVMNFVEHLPSDDKELAKQVVEFANASNK